MSFTWLTSLYGRVLLSPCANLYLIFVGTLALDLHKHPDASVASLIDRLKEALPDGNSSLEADLTEARAELERVVRHSHQVQECMEQLLKDDQDKQKQIEELKQMLLQADQDKQKQIEELKQELKKAMDELEYFFLQSRFQSNMLVEYEKLQEKVTDLLACAFP